MVLLSHSCKGALGYYLLCCSLFSRERIGLKDHQLGGVEEMRPSVVRMV